MFGVTVDTDRLEYDIHSLVKAFYPEETVKVISPSTDPAKAEELKAYVRMRIRLNRSKPLLTFEGGGADGKEKTYEGPDMDVQADHKMPAGVETNIDKNQIKAFI